MPQRPPGNGTRPENLTKCVRCQWLFSDRLAHDACSGHVIRTCDQALDRAPIACYPLTAGSGSLTRMADAPAQESELWLVSVGPGDTRRMTLDQLDQAFSDGMIDEATMLCEVGTEDWQPLYVVAGLEPPTRVTAPGSPAPPHSPPAAESPQAPTEPNAPTHSYRAPAPTEIGPPTAANFAVPDQPSAPDRANVDVDADDAETEITKLPSEKQKQAAIANSAASTSSSSAGAFKVPTPGQPRANALGVPRPAGMRVPGAGLSRGKVGARKSGGFRVPTPDAPAQALPSRSNPPQAASVSPLTAKPLSSRPPAPASQPPSPAVSSSVPAAPRSVAPPLPASFTNPTPVAASGSGVAAPQTEPTTTKAAALDSPFSGMPVASVKRPGESSPETPAAQTEGPAEAQPERPATAEVAPAPAAPLDVDPEPAAGSEPTSTAPSPATAALGTPSVTPPHDPALGVPAPTPGGPQSKAPPLPNNAFAHLSSPPVADSSVGLSSAAVAPGVTPSHAPISPSPVQVVGQSVANAQPALSAATANPDSTVSSSLAPGSLAPGSLAPSGMPSGAPPAATLGMVNPSAPPMVAAGVPAQVATDLDENPFAKPKATGMGRAEKLVLAAACLLSLLLILNRNGVLFGIAKSVGAESTYTSIDGALGGPSLNTERGVQQFVERIKSNTNAPQAESSP